MMTVPNCKVLVGDKMRKIEDYVHGYPRYSALLSAHTPFFMVRRFNRLRARLFLSKQDELSILEQKLDQIDEEERCRLFHGKRRCDTNDHRSSLLKKIDSSLADYDKFIQRTHQTLSLDLAKPRDIRSLQNWLNGTGCIAREERAYLTYSQELVSLDPSGDNALQQLEVWIEDICLKFYYRFRKNRHYNLSIDPNVYLYSDPMVKRGSRLLLLSLITLLLLLPVIICNIISTISIRILVITSSTITYLFILSTLTKPKTIELTLAGATYATVLIVFISGGRGIAS